MSQEDLDRGLELGRLAGELSTVSDVVGMLQMAVLSDFLKARSARLQEVAVDALIRSAGTRALGKSMVETGAAIEKLGEGEVAEGAVRMAVAEAAAQRSQQLSEASEQLAERGLAEIDTAEMAGEAARMSAAAGAVNLAEGSAMVGAGAAFEEVGGALEERAEK
jgi:hypothetical protein